MDALTLSSEETERLMALLNLTVRQVVWDINAVYLVAHTGTTKFETVVRRPESPQPGEYDEAATIAVESLVKSPTFCNVGEEGFWYKVVAQDVVINHIEVVRTAVRMPGETLVAPHSRQEEGTAINACDCGVLVTTSAGVLPAVQVNNAFGFHNWPEVRMYKRDEIARVLDARYQILVVQ